MDYWQKQTSDKPLFDDILWSRPETRQGAGKLLVIGGNAHGFAAAAEAYAAAEAAGAGVVKAVLPEALKRTVGVLGPYEFASSTQSGGFGRSALDELLAGASWADAVLVGGDLGQNSETSVLLESFAKHYGGPLAVTGDTIDYFYTSPRAVMDRPNTLVVLTLAQLQKLATALRHETPFLLGMGTLLLVQALHEFSKKYQTAVMTKESGNIIVAYQGRVSSTRLTADDEDWQVTAAARASVFWMQNPSRPFEALTTALIGS